MAVTVTNTTNKSLYKKIDDSGKYSCVIDLENGTNNNLETDSKTIVGAINEINSKTNYIPVISTTSELNEDFIFNNAALETIFNNTIKGDGHNFIVDFNNGVTNISNRVSTRILFTLKSKFKNGSSGNTYLFDGYYADSSTIYKIYLLFAINGTILILTKFTQKAIKIEEYATF